MKTILTRRYIVEYIIPESHGEEAEIKKIIKEVEGDDEEIIFSEYKLVLPDKKSIANNPVE